MITVYFESGCHSEIVARFYDESIYIQCLPMLEKIAKELRMTVSESVNDDCPKFEPAKEEL